MKRTVFELLKLLLSSTIQSQHFVLYTPFLPLLLNKGLLSKKIKKQFENTNIPRPTNWGGFIVKPIEYEFWQGRENRLHDRIRYNQKDNKWIIERLSP